MNKTAKGSRRGDNSVHNALLSPLPEHLTGKLKTIVVNKCQLCGVGIGKSMVFYEGTWRLFEHSSRLVHLFRWSGGVLRVCLDCFEKLRAMEKPDKYIKRNCVLDKGK